MESSSPSSPSDPRMFDNSSAGGADASAYKIGMSSVGKEYNIGLLKVTCRSVSLLRRRSIASLTFFWNASSDSSVAPLSPSGPDNALSMLFSSILSQATRNALSRSELSASAPGPSPAFSPPVVELDGSCSATSSCSMASIWRANSCAKSSSSKLSVGPADAASGGGAGDAEGAVDGFELVDVWGTGFTEGCFPKSSRTSVGKRRVDHPRI